MQFCVRWQRLVAYVFLRLLITRVSRVYIYIYIYLVDKVPQDIASTVLNIYV